MIELPPAGHERRDELRATQDGIATVVRIGETPPQPKVQPVRVNPPTDVDRWGLPASAVAKAPAADVLWTDVCDAAEAMPQADAGPLPTRASFRVIEPPRVRRPKYFVMVGASQPLGMPLPEALDAVAPGAESITMGGRCSVTRSLAGVPEAATVAWVIVPRPGSSLAPEASWRRPWGRDMLCQRAPRYPAYQDRWGNVGIAGGDYVRSSAEGLAVRYYCLGGR